jgi:hypothetical protein
MDLPYANSLRTARGNFIAAIDRGKLLLREYLTNGVSCQRKIAQSTRELGSPQAFHELWNPSRSFFDFVERRYR